MRVLLLSKVTTTHDLFRAGRVWREAAALQHGLASGQRKEQKMSRVHSQGLKRTFDNRKEKDLIQL